MIKINLAPPRAKKGFTFQVPTFNLGILFGILFAVLVVLIGGVWWYFESETTRLQNEIAENQREIDRLQVVIAEGLKFKKDKEELEKRVNAIEAVARMQPRPVYLMDSVADMLPKDLWLTRMEERSGVIKFGGTTYSSTALSDFMSNLRASGKFKEVDLVEHRQDLTKSPRTITFEVSARFEI
jgi:type IV pilus assembly protein PilN